MDADQLGSVFRMLTTIQSLSHDPEAAELVDSGRRFASNLVAASSQTEDDAGMPAMMSISLLMSLLQQIGGQNSSTTRGLSEKAMSELKERVLTTPSIARLNEKNGEAICSICYDNYVVGSKVIELPCEHAFCVSCGKEWLQRNSTCPVCRAEVKDAVKDRNCNGSWHDEELFPFRFPQGAPLRAARHARDAQQTGTMELWPPVDDMERIAEQHSNWHTFQFSSSSPSRRSGSPPIREEPSAPAVAVPVEPVQPSPSSGSFDIWRSRMFDEGSRRPSLTEESSQTSLVAARAARRSLALSEARQDVESQMRDFQQEVQTPSLRARAAVTSTSTTSSRSSSLAQQGARTLQPQRVLQASSGSGSHSSSSTPSPSSGARTRGEPVTRANHSLSRMAAASRMPGDTSASRPSRSSGQATRSTAPVGH